MRQKITVTLLCALLAASPSASVQETCTEAVAIECLAGDVAIDCGDGKAWLLLVRSTCPTCPAPEPEEPCTPGAACFTRPGSFFTPTPEEPVRRIVMAVPPGSYRRIHLRMDVVHGGWLHPASGLHNVFWLARGGNRDLIGYVNLLGPGRDRILMRHGVGLVQEEKPKVEKPFVARPGETYTFDYVYDMAQGSVELTVWNRGERLATVTAVPNVSRLVVGEKDRFFLDISFPPGESPREPTTFGWEYQNLFLEYIPVQGDPQ